MKKLIILVLVLSGCATEVILPANVKTTKGSYNGDYIDSIDFSFNTDKSPTFSQAKLCVAENISNNDITLRDSADSYVGAYTGTYYQNTNTQNIQGKQTFKYVDEDLSTIIANGTVSTNKDGVFAFIKDIIRYEVKLSTKDKEKVSLEFKNITRAQESTGSVTNNGFTPVGVWAGAGTMSTYSALENSANKLKNCLVN